MTRHLMLLPSLACPASCTYCFGPHEGGPGMSRETVAAVIRWQNALDGGDEPIEFTFHGGEPLIGALKDEYLYVRKAGAKSLGKLATPTPWSRSDASSMNR